MLLSQDLVGVGSAIAENVTESIVWWNLFKKKKVKVDHNDHQQNLSAYMFSVNDHNDNNRTKEDSQQRMERARGTSMIRDQDGLRANK